MNRADSRRLAKKNPELFLKINEAEINITMSQAKILLMADVPQWAQLEARKIVDDCEKLLSQIERLK